MIVVILRSALFAGRRIYGFVGSFGGAGRMHRSFVGSPPLREGLRFLRMTGGDDGGERTVASYG